MPRCVNCQKLTKTSRGLAVHYALKEECNMKLTAVRNVLRRQQRERLMRPTVPTPNQAAGPEPGDTWAEGSGAIPMASSPQPGQVSPRGVTVEDDDESEDSDSQPPSSAGEANDFIIEEYPAEARAGESKGEGTSPRVEWYKAQAGKRDTPWDPFKTYEEWEFAEWIAKSGLSQAEVDKLLKLNWTRNAASPVTFKDKDTFYTTLDSLPTGPKFTQVDIEVKGDQLDENGKPMVEELEMFARDPVECVEELIGNPAFKDHLRYSPTRVRRRSNRKRVYGEAWTADHWWNTQGKLPKGATMAPIILASDKTKLSVLSGDKSAWPVYLTIGNIAKKIRRQPSRQATILLGYLPVAKLHCWSKSKRTEIGYDLFHRCMRRLLEGLVDTGKHGVEMVCADNCVRLVFPLLSAYVADFPEQCLVACTNQYRCPACTVGMDERGNMDLDGDGRIVWSLFRDQADSAEKIAAAFAGNDGADAELQVEGLRCVNAPFWADLPHAQIHRSFTPDLLHQLHKGIFKDHLFGWFQSLLGAAELDKRYQAMPPHPGLRQFRQGISTIKQWTGNEYKQMEKVFVGAIAGAVSTQAAKAARAILDFIHLSQFPYLDEDDLTRMEDCLITFHNVKDIFIEAGVRDDFNIPKIHALLHYIPLIRLHGMPDGYNTESPERLHIDIAKKAYRASNKRDYLVQMTQWLHRQEAVAFRRAYIQWLKPDLDEEVEDAGDREIMEEDSDPSHDAIPPAPGPGDDGDDVSIAGSDDDTTNVVRSVIIRAKRPPLAGVAVSEIVRRTGADDFLHRIDRFLRAAKVTFFPPTNFDKFGLFKRISIQLSLPRDPEHYITDVVRATPAKTPSGPFRKLRKHAYFDTVLVRQPNDAPRVGRVKVLFTLPSAVAPSLAGKVFAYIHWMTRFSPKQQDSGTGLFRLKYAKTNKKKHEAEVIEADSIIRSCHLLPLHDRHINSWLKPDAALDTHETFLFNEHMDLHTFMSL